MPEIAAWPLYADTRDRFIELVQSAGHERVATTVPLTPGWTVLQVAAHVCGLNADLAAGLREGLGTDERTTMQVETRAGRSIEEVCHEWLGHGPSVMEIFADNDFLGHRLHADLVIHLHDVQHGLDVAIDTADAATIDAGKTYAIHTVDRWFEQTGTATAIELTDGDRFQPSAPASVDRTLRATAYDFLRSVSGRRSRSQVEALDWTPDPGPVIESFSPYGALRSVDAPI